MSHIYCVIVLFFTLLEAGAKVAAKQPAEDKVVYASSTKVSRYVISTPSLLGVFSVASHSRCGGFQISFKLTFVLMLAFSLSLVSSRPSLMEMARSRLSFATAVAPWGCYMLQQVLPSSDLHVCHSHVVDDQAVAPSNWCVCPYRPVPSAGWSPGATPSILAEKEKLFGSGSASSHGGKAHIAEIPQKKPAAATSSVCKAALDANEVTASAEVLSVSIYLSTSAARSPNVCEFQYLFRQGTLKRPAAVQVHSEEQEEASTAGSSSQRDPAEDAEAASPCQVLIACHIRGCCPVRWVSLALSDSRPCCLEPRRLQWVCAMRSQRMGTK
eukprot:6490640-Amphidinium_carterae.4